ncbi:MAG: CopG family transcriptional regulator [Deltaproteobacteria bacterium RIFCSPHIGHO2_12_FULL_43_9]|nr:MAG: CopG family transcriptional regulator [Deltaproteobacteria bacterium RIFCSPHIGHO2_12_FULL_43_9]
MAPKRATIYFDPELHKALRLKAADLDSSISDLVNDALKAYFREDAEDLTAIEKRKNEPSLSFEEALRQLKKSGKI